MGYPVVDFKTLQVEAEVTQLDGSVVDLPQGADITPQDEVTILQFRLVDGVEEAQIEWVLEDLGIICRAWIKGSDLGVPPSFSQEDLLQ